MQDIHQLVNESHIVQQPAPPVGHLLPQCGKVGIGCCQQPPCHTAQRQRHRCGNDEAQNFSYPRAVLQMGAQRSKDRARPQEEIPERQEDKSGQRVQRGQAAALPLRQHPAPCQHIPDGEQMPCRPLPVPQRPRLVAVQRVRHGQRHPAYGPERRFLSGGAVRGTGGTVHIHNEQRRKNRHSPIRI